MERRLIDPFIDYPHVEMVEMDVILANLPHMQTGSGVKAEVYRHLSDEDVDPPTYRVRLIGVGARDLLQIERALEQWQMERRALQTEAATRA